MKGILMKPDMIQAIAEGRKTVTRRLFSPQPVLSISDEQFKKNLAMSKSLHTGFGQRYRVGEIVYVKEAWEIEQVNFPMVEISYTSDTYGTDNHDVYIGDKKLPKNLDRIQSPLFMPAWAARHFLKILSVRPERLQDITEDNILKEGIIRSQERYLRPSAVEQFAKLWDSINPKHPFSSNPWIRRIEFKEVERPE